ncbi:MAG: VanZ family protein [Marmoricola sp.]
MQRAFDGQAAFGLLLAAVVGVAVVLIVRSREPPLRTLLWGAFAASVVCVVAITLSPSPGTPSGAELVPFTRLDDAAGRAQAVANGVLTAPSGLLLALLERRFDRLVIVGAALCCGVELLQLVLPIGRIAATEDALLTTAGFVLAAVVGRAVTQFRRPAR